MPQASEELRKRWRGPSEMYAMNYLRGRGYRLLLPAWEWLVPEGRIPTEREMSAAEFLVKEWDFGWFTELDMASDGTRLPTILIDEYVSGYLKGYPDVRRIDSRLRPITVALYREGFVHVGKYPCPRGALTQLAMSVGAWS